MGMIQIFYWNRKSVTDYSAMPGVVIWRGERMCSIFSRERRPFSMMT